MPTKEFKKEVLVELTFFATDEIYEEENVKLVLSEMIDSGRWDIHYRIVIQDLNTNKLYEWFYSVGATEYQDQHSWDDEPDNIKLDEVLRVQTIVTKYIKAKD
jgi:hypothetical protein